MTMMRRLMWGAVFLHVGASLCGSFYIAVFWEKPLWAFGLLTFKAAFWIIWCKNEDQQDRDSWLFRKPEVPPRRSVPFSDFQHDTGQRGAQL